MEEGFEIVDWSKLGAGVEDRIGFGVDRFPEVPMVSAKNVGVEFCRLSGVFEFEDGHVVGGISALADAPDDGHQL